jgi:hypothetical protein
MRRAKISRFVIVFMCLALMFSGTAFAQTGAEDEKKKAEETLLEEVIKSLKRFGPTIRFLHQGYDAYKFVKGLAEAFGFIKSDLEIVKEEIIEEFRNILNEEQRQRIQGDVGAAVDALNGIRNNPGNSENVDDAGINLPFARRAWNEIAAIIDTKPVNMDHIYRLAPVFNVAAVTIALLEKVKDETSDIVQRTLQYNYKMVGADSIYSSDCKRFGNCEAFRTDASLDSLLWNHLGPYPLRECLDDPDRLTFLPVDYGSGRNRRTLSRFSFFGQDFGYFIFFSDSSQGFFAHEVCSPNRADLLATTPATCWLHPYGCEIPGVACFSLDPPEPFNTGRGVPITVDAVPNCYHAAVSRAVAQFNNDETITLIKEAMVEATRAELRRVTDVITLFSSTEEPVCILHASFQLDPPTAGIRKRSLCEVAVDGSCDADGNGVIDRNDIDFIFVLRGLLASDVRIDPGLDADGDGVITVGDARICTLLCTNPNCAP